MANLGAVLRGIGRVAILLVVTAAAVVVGAALFIEYPGGSLVRLAGVVLVVVTAAAGARVGANLATSVLAEYNVAEVAVKGPIGRSSSSPIGKPTGADADEVVEQIERADDDGNVDALIVRLNTPGGKIVPSDDIRIAARRFDGPVVAYATDTCASGGYWIASGCDELWAREGSLVGSIGVIGSRVNASELADRVGLSYERLAAGEYKDAGMPLKEMTDDDRAYLQGLIDDYYETFVDRVSEGRGLDPDEVRDTEARVYVGREAHEEGLVDEIGTRKDIEDDLADSLGVEEVQVREFEPARSLPERLQRGARGVAHAFGAGVAGILVDDEFEFRA